MSVSLVRFDNARRALKLALRIDEVKCIHDKAAALLAYAKQAGDFELQNHAAEIRLLAERRAGQLLVDMNATGQRQAKERGRPTKVSTPTTLPKLGITRDQSSKWQRLARMIDDATFERALAQAKQKYGELTTAGLLREVKEVVRPKSTRTEEDINEVADDLLREIERRHERLNAVVKDKERLNPMLRRKLISALEHEAREAKKLSDGFTDFENTGKAYQRIVRERMAKLPEDNLEEKRLLASSLKNATIREISREDGRGLLLQFEWLASLGSSEFYFGLYWGSFLGGVVAFGSTAGTNVASSVCGAEHRDKVITLTRGCCSWWSHEHSGSFLVAGACREMAKKGYNIIVANSDTEAGEQGVIFRACNFLFCGETGATERFRTPDGRVRDSRLVSGYTRDRTGGTLTYRRSRAAQKEMMLQEGVEFFRGAPKLRWVGFFGDRRTKRLLRQALRWEVLPYPKRQQPLTIEAPPPDELDLAIPSPQPPVTSPAPKGTRKPMSPATVKKLAALRPVTIAAAMEAQD
jgi:hypothetical protein